MRDKSVARALLERFYGGERGANEVMHAAIEAAILEEALRKRLTWWEYRWVLQDAEGVSNREVILYKRLARELTRPEMEDVHQRIHAAIRQYQDSLEARKKAPR